MKIYYFCWLFFIFFISSPVSYNVATGKCLLYYIIILLNLCTHKTLSTLNQSTSSTKCKNWPDFNSYAEHFDNASKHGAHFSTLCADASRYLETKRKLVSSRWSEMHLSAPTAFQVIVHTKMKHLSLFSRVHSKCMMLFPVDHKRIMFLQFLST